jgi:hypothetical protein
MRATRLQTRRHGQTVSWGEKTLPEVGRLRNHFRFGVVVQFEILHHYPFRLADVV